MSYLVHRAGVGVDRSVPVDRDGFGLRTSNISSSPSREYSLKFWVRGPPNKTRLF